MIISVQKTANAVLNKRTQLTLEKPTRAKNPDDIEVQWYSSHIKEKRDLPAELSRPWTIPNAHPATNKPVLEIPGQITQQKWKQAHKTNKHAILYSSRLSLIHWLFSLQEYPMIVQRPRLEVSICINISWDSLIAFKTLPSAIPRTGPKSL